MSKISNAAKLPLFTRLRMLVKKYGWKALVVLFFAYLIRDTFLYILLPALVIWGIKGP